MLAPISRLPVENFSRIFRCDLPPVADDDWELWNGEPHSSFRGVYGGHIILASVCGSWRCMVLGDHSLWTEIKESCLDLVPELLIRSGAAALSVSLRHTRNIPSDITNKALEYISRQHDCIRRLSIRLEYLEIKTDSLLWKLAPNLMYLNLEDGTILTPPNRVLFDGIAPCITSRHVECYIFMGFVRPSQDALGREVGNLNARE
ncbi:hypothetical protein AX16_005822 [Volvariella volvacea WC 439]|nr:hypothetical protein AX16_005822 [Volvariella volvacea WC 439]